MATVTSNSVGYEFERLSPAGMRLVKGFQRLYPQLCQPSPYPSFRVIRVGNPDQTRSLEKLVAEVRTLDPEPTRSFSPFTRHVARDLSVAVAPGEPRKRTGQHPSSRCMDSS